MNYTISHIHCLKCPCQLPKYYMTADNWQHPFPIQYSCDLSAHVTRQQSNLIQHFDTYNNWSILLPIDQQTNRLLRFTNQYTEQRIRMNAKITWWESQVILHDRTLILLHCPSAVNSCTVSTWFHSISNSVSESHVKSIGAVWTDAVQL